MKLHAHSTTHYHTVTAYSANDVRINGQNYQGSLIVMPRELLQPWRVERFEDLRPEHFAELIVYQPQVVLLGSGQRHRFPGAHLLAPLHKAGIGVETMDSQAACRTYNILMMEERRVLLALILET